LGWLKFEFFSFFGFQKKFVNTDYLVYCLIKGVTSQEEKLIYIYKGVVPFIIIQLIGLFMVAIWP
jgi:TRAP-type mannitol/chloroaromatic compound transport system permease large subunit